MSPDKTPTPRRRPSLLRVRLRLRGLLKELRKITALAHALSEAIDDLSPLAEVLAHLDATQPRPTLSFPLLRRHARFVREQEGLTRADLAALVGVAPATIRNFECGRNRPVARTEARLFRLLAERAQHGRYAPEVVESLRLAGDLTADERKRDREPGEPALTDPSAPTTANSPTENQPKGTTDDPDPQALRARHQLGTPHPAEAARASWSDAGRARRARRHRPRHPARH